MLSDILEQNKRMEDIVLGLASQNVALVSENINLQSQLDLRTPMAQPDPPIEEVDGPEEHEQNENAAIQDEGSGISNQHTIVHGSHLSRYINGHHKFAKVLNRAIGTSRYTGSSPLAKQLCATAAALSPQNSFKNMELVLALLLNQATFRVDCDIGLKEEDISKLANTVSSASKLKDFVADAAADSSFEAWDEIVTEGCKLFILCDKGARKLIPLTS
jgi:hypothetical protein